MAKNLKLLEKWYVEKIGFDDQAEKFMSNYADHVRRTANNWIELKDSKGFYQRQLIGRLLEHNRHESIE